MDPTMLISEVAKALGLNPLTILLLLFVTNLVARAITRAIPDDATGWRAFVRQLTAVIAVEVSPRITAGASIATIAKAALEEPAIAARVKADPARTVGQ